MGAEGKTPTKKWHNCQKLRLKSGKIAKNSDEFLASVLPVEQIGFSIEVDLGVESQLSANAAEKLSR